jgi:hypothetical protein
MTDTLTSAGDVTGFLQVLFETATGPSWQDTQGVFLAPDSAWRSGARGDAEGTSLDEHQQLAGEHHRLRHIHLAHLGVMERREEGKRG